MNDKKGYESEVFYITIANKFFINLPRDIFEKLEWAEGMIVMKIDSGRLIIQQIKNKD
jgi:hypothetical protein